MPLSPFSLASQGRNLPPSIKDIESVVKALCQNAFELEDGQSIFTISKGRDRAIDMLEVNTVLLARIKQMFSDIFKSYKCLAKKILFQSPGYG